MSKMFKTVLSLIVAMTIFAVPAGITGEPDNANAATMVYVTRTGKHYFYHRHNRGLNRARKVFKVSLQTAKHRGLTLAATDQATAHHKRVTHHRHVKRRTVVKRVPVKHIKQAKASASGLQKLKYHGQQIVIINHDQPKLNRLSIKKGAWQHYGNLDRLNRVTTADAMLNKRLMPHAERQPLYVNPTGWHNKRGHGGWLYNRSHLIGYQLTGQNNNLKNLMTGTRSLNAPGMEKYENQVASYLRSSRSHYVRYEVKPVFAGNNLLANGVEMQAESIGSHAIRFNIYIFNVQPGFRLNYRTGTSKAA